MRDNYNEYGDDGKLITSAYSDWFKKEWAKVTADLKPKIIGKNIILSCVSEKEN